MKDVAYLVAAHKVHAAALCLYTHTQSFHSNSPTIHTWRLPQMPTEQQQEIKQHISDVKQFGCATAFERLARRTWACKPSSDEYAFYFSSSGINFIIACGHLQCMDTLALFHNNAHTGKTAFTGDETTPDAETTRTAHLQQQQAYYHASLSGPLEMLGVALQACTNMLMAS